MATSLDRYGIFQLDPLIDVLVSMTESDQEGFGTIPGWYPFNLVMPLHIFAVIGRPPLIVKNFCIMDPS